MKAKYLILFMLLVALHARGQSSTDDQQLTAAAVTALKSQYGEAFKIHPQLYNGPEYIDYSRRYYTSTGHQFFTSPEFQAGSVYYNQHDFPSVVLNYDVVLDQLVMKNPSNPLTFRLINENVRHFSIAGHQFVRLVSDSTASKVLATGYYEVLVDSTAQVLAKRSKRMQERADQNKINVEFISTDRLFIQKAGKYYPASSKGSTMRAFSDRSKEIQKYIQANKIKFKKRTRENDIIAVAQYYNSLPTQ